MFRRGHSPRGIGRRALLTRALLVFFVALAVLILAGCASGYVTTSTGAIVPAAVVEAQDTVADIVSEMKTAYLQAIAAHDARAGTEDPALHETHRKALLDFKAGLQGTAHGLAAWKQTNAAAAPAEILRPSIASIRSFLVLSVDLGVLKEGRAAQIRAFIDAAFPPGGDR
jgi:outer membrane murein-binding lipoprotein Lpp